MEITKHPFYRKINDFVGRHKAIKKILGAILLFIGIIAFVTPFTPGAIWIMVLGLELLGFHFLFWFRVKDYWLTWKEKFTKRGPLK